MHTIYFFVHLLFFSHRYQTQYLSRSIEYCDVDDIKAEYAAEIKQVIALANTGTPAGSAANSVHGFAGAENKADGQEAEGEEGATLFIFVLIRKRFL